MHQLGFSLSGAGSAQELPQLASGVGGAGDGSYLGQGSFGQGFDQLQQGTLQLPGSQGSSLLSAMRQAAGLSSPISDQGDSSSSTSAGSTQRTKASSALNSAGGINPAATQGGFGAGAASDWQWPASGGTLVDPTALMGADTQYVADAQTAMGKQLVQNLRQQAAQDTASGLRSGQPPSKAAATLAAARAYKTAVNGLGDGAAKQQQQQPPPQQQQQQTPQQQQEQQKQDAEWQDLMRAGASVLAGTMPTDAAIPTAAPVAASAPSPSTGRAHFAGPAQAYLTDYGLDSVLQGPLTWNAPGMQGCKCTQYAVQPSQVDTCHSCAWTE